MTAVKNHSALNELRLSDGIRLEGEQYMFEGNTLVTLARLKYYLGEYTHCVIPEFRITETGEAQLVSLPSTGTIPSDHDSKGLKHLMNLLRKHAMDFVKDGVPHSFNAAQTKALSKHLPIGDIHQPEIPYLDAPAITNIDPTAGVKFKGSNTTFPFTPQTASLTHKFKGFLGSDGDTITPRFIVGKDGQAQLVRLERHIDGRGLRKLNGLLGQHKPELVHSESSWFDARQIEAIAPHFPPPVIKSRAV